ncbi:SDR family oxidoreductase [Nocardia noduli]|uniref:SDR family NAD(P)-dependent oxidoreductase n=1 Tax=Nocardia noduli TaxID=2815722 RepID=UPI0021125CAE
MLQNKSALVMGAGGGVGAATALRFSGEGARVVCADIRLEGAKETVRAIESAGGIAVAVKCDVSDEADAAAAVSAVVEHFGRLDIIFNNVGIPTPRLGDKLEDHTAEDFQRLTAVNFGGVFNGCKHAVVQFKKQGGGGVILNTGSVAGLVAWGGTVYGATKGAVHQLTKAIAIEGAPFGIRANAICPAGMPFTNFMAAGGLGDSPEARDQLVKHTEANHPLGKAITAEDCAEAALYLVSDHAANVTGVLLPVDGGYVAK